MLSRMSSCKTKATFHVSPIAFRVLESGSILILYITLILNTYHPLIIPFFCSDTLLLVCSEFLSNLSFPLAAILITCLFFIFKGNKPRSKPMHLRCIQNILMLDHCIVIVMAVNLYAYALYMVTQTAVIS